MNIFINGDCMNPENGMPSYPDKYFDLAIVDPPYGIKEPAHRIYHEAGKAAALKKNYNKALWNQDKPDNCYFDELFRVSKNQIIWGGNYFSLPGSRCFLVWDKVTTNNPFADAELAWTSFKGSVRIFKYQWNGMIQENMKDKELRIHPTQKPVALYKWLCKNYAKEEMKLLDTHVGSASSLIAFEEFGLEYVGYELDPDYYKAASERLEKHREQLRLFEPGFDK